MKAFVYYLYQTRQPQAAVALATTWGGLLRSNEVLALTSQDFVFRRDVRLISYSSIVAAVTSRSGKNGKDQFDPIIDTTVASITYKYAAVYRSTGKVFPSLSYHSYLKSVKQAAIFLDLGGKPFSTHSARIGSALYVFCIQEPSSHIDLIGGWKSLTSLEHYLNNGRVWLTNLSVADKAQQDIYFYAEEADTRCKCQQIRTNSLSFSLYGRMWNEDHQLLSRCNFLFGQNTISVKEKHEWLFQEAD